MRDGGSSSSSSTTFIISVLIAVAAMMEEWNGQPRVGLVLVLHNLVRYRRRRLVHVAGDDISIKRSETKT